MGKIKKILENELIGSTQSTEVYPVTSIKAVYDENNERLDNIIDRKDNEIQKELEAEVIRATDAESNLRETINNITEINGNATSANIVTIDTIPNTSSSNVQQALNELFKNATFAGIATPTTNPGTPDGNVFYIAGEGTYPNFSNLVIDKGQLGILKWNGTWSKQVLEIGTDSGNMILDWNTDVATTRKQVISKLRKSGVQISYKDPDSGWINEQYIGAYTTDDWWANDAYWVRIPNDEDINQLAEIKKVWDNTEKLFTWTFPVIQKLDGNKINQDGTITTHNLSLFRYIKVTAGKTYLLKNTRGNSINNAGGANNYQVPYCFYNVVPSVSITTDNVVGEVPSQRYIVGDRYYVLVAPEGAEYLATWGYNGTGTQVRIEIKESGDNRIDDIESRLSENDINIAKLFSLIEKAKTVGDWVDIPLQNNPYVEFTQGKFWQASNEKVVLGNASSITAVKVNVSAFGNIDYIRAKFLISYNWRFCYGTNSEGTIIKDFTGKVAQGIPDNLDKKFIGFANSNFDYFYFNVLTTNIEEAKLGFFVGDYYLPNEPYNGFIKVWKPIELLDVKQTLPTIPKDTLDYYGANADKYTIIEECPKRIEGIRTMFSNTSANFSIAIAIKVDEDRFSIISDEIPCNTEKDRANLLSLLENPIILKANQYLAIKCTSNGVMIPTNYQTYTGYRYSHSIQAINKSIVNAYHPIEIVEYVDRNKYLLSDETNNVSGLACREIHFLSDYNAARNIKADGTFNHVLSSEVKVKNALYDVRAIVTVPADYLASDKKYPLVLAFHENGSNAERIIDTSNYNICQYLVSLGYICCCAEISQDWAKENGLYSGEGAYKDLNIYSSPLILQTYIDLYKKIVEEYNIDTEKVYMTGGSMGGFNALSLAEIFPFRIAAVAADSPVLDSRVLWYTRPETHKYTAEYFDFDNKDSIQNAPEDIFEEAKLDGSNYCIRNIQGEYPFDFDKTTDNSLIVKWKEGVNINNMTWKKFTTVPVKSIVSSGDTICGFKNQEAYITALKRGGSIADIRVWQNGGHIISSSIGKYIMQTSKARTLSSTGTIYATHYEIADWFYKFGGLKPVVALQEGMKFEIGLPESIELTENPLIVQAFVNFDTITDDRDKGIKWSLAEEDAAIANINAFGKLTLTGVGSITLTANSLAVPAMTVSKVITILTPPNFN